MSLPTVSLSPVSGPAGTVVTATVTRDAAPSPITLTATTPGGSGSATFNIIEALSASASPARALTTVSDNGSVAVYTFVA